MMTDLRLAIIKLANSLIDLAALMDEKALANTSTMETFIQLLDNMRCQMDKSMAMVQLALEKYTKSIGREDIMEHADYNGRFEIGKDCLNPDMKRARIEAKARALENNPISDDEILREALKREQDSHFKGIIDPGAFTD